MKVFLFPILPVSMVVIGAVKSDFSPWTLLAALGSLLLAGEFMRFEARWALFLVLNKLFEDADKNAIAAVEERKEDPEMGVTESIAKTWIQSIASVVYLAPLISGLTWDRVNGFDFNGSFKKVYNSIRRA